MGIQTNASWTPNISANIETGQFIISGRSLPEDPRILFKPLLETVEKYIANPASSTAITVNLEYINTSSTKWLFNILKQFELLFINNHPIIVNFVCVDETIRKTIQLFELKLNLPINVVMPDNETVDK